MVNLIVLNYLRTYKSKYNLNKLKAMILSKGYSEKDYEEAMVQLNKEPKPIVSKPPIKEPTPPISGVVGVPTGELDSGNKWIKASAIIGAILSILFIVLAILGYTDISWSDGIFGNILSVLIILMLCFYLYGFVIVGKNNKLKWIKISSLLFGISIIICSLMVTFILGWDKPDSSRILPLIFLGFIIFVIVILRSIFSISLIRNRKIIGFGLAAGILGALMITLFALFSMIIIYLTILDNQISDISILIFKIIFQASLFLTLVFESIVLWKASNV
jgi:hypothetical protein